MKNRYKQLSSSGVNIVTSVDDDILHRLIHVISLILQENSEGERTVQRSSEGCQERSAKGKEDEEKKLMHHVFVYQHD